jgi:hypothetical protein
MTEVALNLNELEVLMSALQLLDKEGEALFHGNPSVSLSALYNKLYSVSVELQEVYV